MGIGGDKGGLFLHGRHHSQIQQDADERDETDAPVKDQNDQREHCCCNQTAQNVHQHHGHHVLDTAHHRGANTGELPQTVGVEEAHGHPLELIGDGNAAVSRHEITCMGLEHLRITGGHSPTEDADQYQNQCPQSNALGRAAAGQPQNYQINSRDLRHLQKGIQNADSHGLVDVAGFISGKLPDFTECFDHSASPSFAPMCACHISL